ncbi:hypothetical protein ILUMI_08685, partial [Ignelater luminosus]
HNDPSTTTTSTSTVTSVTTPCPTLATPEPSRCPKTEVVSDKECETRRRFHPNPIRCDSDADCVSPFNVCCKDGCFNMTQICKTYRAELIS